MAKSAPIILAFALLLALPGQARADLVRMSNGRVISVEAVRFEGDSVILEFRGGGEVKAPKDLVAEILPDEVPYAKAFALEALAASHDSRAASDVGNQARRAR